ncbi:caspase family protein [Dankookia sp. P2]|uniref:caspase family protein n=1 Tax=Dankookia sp. P2 TaxID=3423955 RepID=UPI003D67BAEA
MPALANPGADARAVAAELSRLGFEGGRVEPLLDLDLAGLLQAVRAFGDRARGAELAVVYFSGHGLQLAPPRASRRRSYLLPIDARLEDARDVPRQALALSELLAETAGRSQGAVVILLDACRNNPAVVRLAGQGTRGAQARSGLLPIAQDRLPLGTLVSYATSAGAVADDGTGRNSPYATALAQHLRTPGLDVVQVLRRVRADVRQATGGRQEPEIVDRLNADVVLAALPQQTQPVPASVDRETVFWQSAVAGGTRGDFEAYLQAYPSGSYVPLARSRLAVLSNPNMPVATLTAPTSRADDEWTAESRLAARMSLKALGYWQGEPDGQRFDTAMRLAIRRWQASLGAAETGALDLDALTQLGEQKDFLNQLLGRPPLSPLGTSMASVTGGAARFAKGWTVERPQTGASNFAEAAYWYGLAAQDGEPRAFHAA